MSQHTENQPLSKDQILDELQFLVTVEHALIVEYLSVSCALGHDLATVDGGPATEASREAAAGANTLAGLQMQHVATLVRALYSFRPTTGLGRATEIADSTGASIPLGPPTREQLENLVERQEAIAAAVDAQYAQLSPAMAFSGSGEDSFSDDLRAAVEYGTTHADQVSRLRKSLGDQPITSLLRATDWAGRTQPDQVLLRISNRTYQSIVSSLGSFYRDLDLSSGIDAGPYRSGALSSMDVMNDVNRALVHVGLLPPFQLPPS